MESTKLFNSVRLTFWSILLTLFSLNLFDIGPISSGHLFTIAGIVLGFMALSKLVKEDSKFKIAFVFLFIYAALIVVNLVLAFVDYGTGSFNQASTLLQSKEIIPVEILNKMLVVLCLSVVMVAVQILWMIFLAQGLRNLCFAREKRALHREGKRRVKGLGIFGVVYFIGMVAACSGLLTLFDRLNAYYANSNPETTMNLTSATQQFTLAAVILMVGVISFYVSSIKFLMYISRVKLIVDKPNPVYDIPSTPNVDQNPSQTSSGGEGSSFDGRDGQTKQTYSYDEYVPGTRIKESDVVDVEIEKKKEKKKNWDDEIK
ncbi:hypothetical protein GX831_03005 [bacterium]|nr:hypothetical protein [bacterium]